MSAIVEQIRPLVEQIVEHTDVFIVEISLRGERSSKVIEVFVDTDKGISLEQCSHISRELSVKLDESDFITGRYRLDVSSPGLDRPLKLRRQYEKNIGRMCKVSFQKGDAQTTAEGVLDQVNEGMIVLAKNGKKTEIPFSDIKETLIIPQIK